MPQLLQVIVWTDWAVLIMALEDCNRLLFVKRCFWVEREWVGVDGWSPAATPPVEGTARIGGPRDRIVITCFMLSIVQGSAETRTASHREYCRS